VFTIITDPLFYCAAIPAVILLGLAKGGFSGMGTAATPLVALYLPPFEAAALLLPILMTQDLISAYVYRRDWDAWNLKVMLPGAVVGVVVAWFLASRLPDDAVRVIVGTIGVVFVINSYLRRGNLEPTKKTAASGMIWGSVSGFTSFMTQAGAPPFQVHVMPQRLPKLTFVGTATIFFAVVNILKIVPYSALSGFNTRNMATSVVLLPLAILANFGGIWLVKHMPTRLFYGISYVLLFFVSTVLLWQGVSGFLAARGPA
jgi:uncharacterized membrane protein YfcA